MIGNNACGVLGSLPFLALYLSPTPSGFVLFGEPSPQSFVTKGVRFVPHRLSNPPTHALYAIGACMSVPLPLMLYM